MEAIVFALLFLLIVAGGSYSVIHIPTPWAALQNPATIKEQSDLAGLALYYNTTLADLGEERFANVSQSLGTIALLNIPAAVNDTAARGITQISAMNVSIPNALTSFAQVNRSILQGHYANATAQLRQGCQLVNSSLGVFAQFENVTTPALSKLGVPVPLYSPGAGLVRSEIASLSLECTHLTTILSSVNSTGASSQGINFTISSPQKAIQTGGQVVLDGKLLNGNSGIAEQNVSFYFNGTWIGSTLTTKNGTLHATLRIRYVYVSLGIIWALAAKNSTINFPGRGSNYLFFTILFNETQITIGDPPPFLPTFSFTVSGNLSTIAGKPLPSAPVEITFFNQSYPAMTNAEGVFAKTLTVPANATDGVAYVYAAFAPHGTFGPAFNLTSILVYHEALNISVVAPAYSYSGFNSVITGKVEANNTALPNASVMLNSPWGNFPARTDQSGHFSVSVPVPLWDFAFSRKLAASVAPPEPYMTGGAAVFTVKLFNILLWVNVPVFVVIVVTLEARRVRLISKLSSRLSSRKREATEISSIEEPPSVSGPETTLPAALLFSPSLVETYRETLALAAKKFSLTFKESATIRQTIREVKALDKNPESARIFASISLIVEDFLYSESFDASKIEVARELLGRLRTLYEEQAEVAPK